MSDVFREVDEDLRKERLGKLWKRFAPFVYAVAALIVIATAGYRGWQAWQENQAQTSGDAFLAAIQAIDDGKGEEGQALLGGLEKAAGGYPLLARMRSATELANSGDQAGAIAAFDKIAGDTSLKPVYRDMATIRSAYLMLDTQDAQAVAQRLAGLEDAGNPWHHAAWEILGMAEWKAGNEKSALVWVEKIVEDTTSPQDIAARARMMQELLASDGIKAEAESQKDDGAKEAETQ
ncbi:MAG: tetratricopeptide repeat protein [Stappiaceae bacterium]